MVTLVTTNANLANVLWHRHNRCCPVTVLHFLHNSCFLQACELSVDSSLEGKWNQTWPPEPWLCIRLYIQLGSDCVHGSQSISKYLRLNNDSNVGFLLTAAQRPIRFQLRGIWLSHSLPSRTGPALSTTNSRKVLHWSSYWTFAFITPSTSIFSSV